MEYNMLVRDRYPEILSRNGKKRCIVEQIPEEKFGEKLAEKLDEKTQAFLDAFEKGEDERALNELADIEEVIASIIGEIGISSEAFKRICEARASLYGRFEERKLLKEIVTEE